VDESGPFREAAKKHRIRYLEETVEKRGYLGPVINAPEIAKTVVPEIAQEPNYSNALSALKN
jgi:hypothetical protein